MGADLGFMMERGESYSLVFIFLHEMRDEVINQDQKGMERDEIPEEVGCIMNNHNIERESEVSTET